MQRQRVGGHLHLALVVAEDCARIRHVTSAVRNFATFAFGREKGDFSRCIARGVRGGCADGGGWTKKRDDCQKKGKKAGIAHNMPGLTEEEEEEDGSSSCVAVESGPLPSMNTLLLSPVRECEVVLPLREYDSDLGMRTRRAVRRQLDVDLPRSVVMVRGRRASTSSDVVSSASHPRLCTQAVLAPPVEWMIRAGAVAHEPEEGRWPMVVEADGAITRVRKRLGIRCCESGERMGEVDVHVHADALHGAVVVTIHKGL